MKQTEIGEIPVEWGVVRLEDVSDFITKGSTPTTYGYDWAKEGVVFLRSECVGVHGFTLSGAMHISEDAHRVMNRSVIKSGDILMTITGNVGRVCVLPQSIREANINQHIARIRINSADVDSSFVHQFLSQENIIKEYSKITTGQAYPQLSLKQVRETFIALPSLPEQQKIAEILSTVDEKMAVIGEQLAKTAELKTGLMQRLLAKGIGHTEFKDSPLGEIPKGWEVIKLDQLTEKISDGIHSTPEYVETSPYHFINGNNLNNGEIKIGKNAKCVSEKEYLNHKKDLNERSILMSINGTIGNLAFFKNENVILGKSAAYISCKKSLIVRYLYYSLQSDRVKLYFSKEVTGTTIKNLSLRTIKNTPLTYPPLAEQQQIANILTTIDDKIQVLHDKKAHYQTLKRGLMQQLLTGNLRVRVAQDAVAA